MKNLPSVAALTAERDGEIRKAALNTLATAYKNLGKAFPFLFPAVDFSCYIRTVWYYPIYCWKPLVAWPHYKLSLLIVDVLPQTPGPLFLRNAFLFSSNLLAYLDINV